MTHEGTPDDIVVVGDGDDGSALNAEPSSPKEKESTPAPADSGKRSTSEILQEILNASKRRKNARQWLNRKERHRRHILALMAIARKMELAKRAAREAEETKKKVLPFKKPMPISDPEVTGVAEADSMEYS